MKHARLDLASSANLLPPLGGTIAVFGPIDLERLSGLDAVNLRAQSDAYSITQQLKSANVAVERVIIAPCDHAVVLVPRSKDETWQLISTAISTAPDGWIVVDGQKTDGIESIAKQITRHVPDLASYSKGHGKTVWFQARDAKSLVRETAQATENKGGYLTAPGVFSADDVDPASELLMQHVPEKLSGHIADLGAGWGYLSAQVLKKNAAIKAVHLVEDNAIALDCARENIADARAEFHWANALTWKPAKPMDAVIMNPPFHTSRNAEPSLGLDFIRAAARTLRPGGQLFMVANAHLPYEPALEQNFDQVELLFRTSRFKVFSATRGRSKVV